MAGATHRGNIADVDDAYGRLVGAILRSERESHRGPHGFGHYLEGPCGRFWCEAGGLEPKVVYETHYKALKIDAPPYEEMKRCSHCRGPR